MKLANWHRSLVRFGPKNIFDYLFYGLTFPLGLLFGLIAKVRVFSYRKGLISSYRAAVPVISVGNLAVGGTGKTPVTDLLLAHLLKNGIKVAVVSRGYGRNSTEPVTVVCAGNGPMVSPDAGGDEPVLLARRNPESIVIVAPDRKQGIQRAVSEYKAEVILLDDGFQHLKAQRDFDILLLDAKKPFGNGFPLPLGLLREFPSAIKRADIVVLTRSEGDELLQIHDKPVLRLRYGLSDHAIDAKGTQIDLISLSPGRVGAFAGIADPESFFNSLKASGINPSETLSFADHVVYSTSEIEDLRGLARGCDVLLTTEKDLVKLQDVKLPCDCLAVPLAICFVDDGESLTSLVDTFLDQYKERYMLSDELIEILACPKCKGEVSFDKENEQVVCDQCKLAYPVRDGIPAMLVDEAENF